MTGQLLTARELAAYLGVTAGTILDWFEAGRLPGFRLGGRKGGPVRFRLAEIEETLERWHVNGPDTGGEVSPTPGAPDPKLVFQVSPTPTDGGEDAC